MATGKTVGKHGRFYVGGIDLSGASRAADAALEFDAPDVTAWTDGWKNVLINQPAAVINYKAWFDNTATTGAHTVLSAPAERIATWAIGIRAAPATGDPLVAVYLQQRSYVAPQDGGAVAIETHFDKGSASGSMTANNIYGVVLKEDGLISSTTNGSAVNNGAATAAGGWGFLHVTAAGGTWAFIIEDSADGSSGWATIATFAANGTSVTAEQKAVTGAVRQYLRYTATKTSGNFTGLIGFVRGK